MHVHCAHSSPIMKWAWQNEGRDNSLKNETEDYLFKQKMYLWCYLVVQNI